MREGGNSVSTVASRVRRDVVDGGRSGSPAQALGAGRAGPIAAGASVDTPGSGEFLRRMHLEIFVYWLGLSLRQKERDAGMCCGNSAPDSARLRTLRRAAEGSIPPDAMKPERELFLQDIELVVALMANRD